jgi:hypothetical protein
MPTQFQKSIAFGRFPGFTISPSGEKSMKKMSVEHGWNDTDRGEPKYLEKNLSKCHFFHYKCHVAVVVKGRKRTT